MLLAQSLLEERFNLRAAALSLPSSSDAMESGASSERSDTGGLTYRKSSRNLVKRILRLLQEMLVALLKVKLLDLS